MTPLLVASLSLVPGAGHLVVGKKWKGAALFAMDIGIVASLFFLRSPAGRLLTCLVYLMVMVPAVIETYRFAQGGVSRFSESKPYIVALLLMSGLSALPLLWQSPVFTLRMKVTGSIVVLVLAILYFWLLSVYGGELFRYVDHWWGKKL